MTKTLLVQFKTDEEIKILDEWREKRIRGHGSLRKNILLLMQNDLNSEVENGYSTNNQ
jgi:hypothetical protein